MNTTLRAQAETIVTASIHAVLPDEAVRRAHCRASCHGAGGSLLVSGGQGRVADGPGRGGSAGPCRTAAWSSPSTAT